jgi:hypothetical protein
MDYSTYMDYLKGKNNTSDATPAGGDIYKGCAQESSSAEDNHPNDSSNDKKNDSAGLLQKIFPYGVGLPGIPPPLFPQSGTGKATPYVGSIKSAYESVGTLAGAATFLGVLFGGWLICPAAEATAVQFGNNPNQVYHTFRHIVEEGLSIEPTKQAVLESIKTVGSQIESGVLFNQTIIVNGVQITYTAFRLANGTINVGRITVGE